jgi:regulator of cell morphogenesis and NO signaling
MNKVTEFMAKDHDRLDSIFEKFKGIRHTDVAKAKVLYNDFFTGLKRHIIWEEEILFPVLEDKTGMRDTGPVAVMRMEHRRIEDYLEKIHNKISANEIEDIDELENTLSGLLTEHNDKEENVLYPWIDREASEQEKDEAFTKMRNLSPEKFNKY